MGAAAVAPISVCVYSLIYCARNLAHTIPDDTGHRLHRLPLDGTDHRAESLDRLIWSERNSWWVPAMVVHSIGFVVAKHLVWFAK